MRPRRRTLHLCGNWLRMQNMQIDLEDLSRFPGYCHIFTATRGFQTLEYKYFDMFDMLAVIKHCLKTFQSSIKIMAKCFRKIPGCLM